MAHNIIHHILHPLISSVLKGMVEHEFVRLNEKSVTSEKNAIFVTNHGTKYDVPYSALLIKKHFWLVAGTQRLNFVDRLFFGINGTVWVDRLNKESRARGKEIMLNKLLSGENLFICPEGTWNTKASLPMLPLPWGVIELSQKTGCPIIPFALDFTEKTCYINIGDAIACSEGDDKKQRIDEVRDKLATLRWEIWEKYFKANRSEVSADEWEKEVARRMASYPPIDAEYESSCVRAEKNAVGYEEMFSHLDSLAPKKENAFLYNKRLKG